MNVQQLDMYYRFCQCKSVSKVARDLNLKQPTVSFHLKKLRDSVGITLYEQKGEEIVLTSAGAMLHQYAEKILRLVSETERVMKDYQSFNRGELHIGASTIPASYVLPPICSQFFSKKPNVQITLHVHSAPTIKKMVKEKEVDFGVISTQPMKDSLLVEKEIVSDHLVFVISHSHEYAIFDKITRHDIEKVPIYIHSSGSTREMINEWAEKEKLSLNIRMELTSIEAIKKMVSLGEGGAILSKRAVQEEAQQNVLTVHSLPELGHNRSISLIYRNDRPISPLMQEFMTDLFREV
ncbi:LysR family transcriptional regulator [Halalkalibacter sp. APA_J-10(15)]|uniref:LysR family transcriptional regulator n=1 Tax=Halalkalibacter sp. APA_J-10(15) TaxID=2933805 RepID=UPI001FF64809|nr:LysR family transcriptional regulator [Halalkalibacter sp. APA_J-10(15)]MCK0470463.1 LysR family transcriptional regulator [Halalkalibacter sp. APA_J-10(15)]